MVWRCEHVRGSSETFDYRGSGVSDLQRNTNTGTVTSQVARRNRKGVNSVGQNSPGSRVLRQYQLVDRSAIIHGQDVAQNIGHHALATAIGGDFNGVGRAEDAGSSGISDFKMNIRGSTVARGITHSHHDI